MCSHFILDETDTLFSSFLFRTKHMGALLHKIDVLPSRASSQLMLSFFVK